MSSTTKCRFLVYMTEQMTKGNRSGMDQIKHRV